MKKRSRVLSALLTTALLANTVGALQTIPAGGSWKGAIAELEPNCTILTVRDAEGRKLCDFHGEPYTADLSSLIVKPEGDRLAIDASAAFAAGLKKLVMGVPIDKAPLCGYDCTIKSDVEGAPGVRWTLFFEGQTEASKHFYTYQNMTLNGRLQPAGMTDFVPKDLRELHLRFDLESSNGDRPVLLGAFQTGTISELPLRAPKKKVEPKLVFHVPFDGTAEAAVGAGRRTPLDVRDLEFVPGRSGQAARFSAEKKTHLEYAIADNMDPDRGTVTMWVKRDWDLSLLDQPWQDLFTFPFPEERTGSGALWFWWYGDSLRGDVSDAGDHYRCAGIPVHNRWIHLAFRWDEDGVSLFANGRRCDMKDDSLSPMVAALRSANRDEPDRSIFKSFYVGNRGDAYFFNGLIDDFRIYSGALPDADIRAIFEEFAQPGDEDPAPDYPALVKARPANPFVLQPIDEAGTPGPMTLLEEIKLDKPLPADRFRAVGPVAVRELDGMPYLEAGPAEGNRFAVRVKLDTTAPLHCIEIDYPDDKVRTADITVMPLKGMDWALDVGYATGDEYANSGKIRTNRCIYWNGAPEIYLAFMTARENQPAAASAIRVYRIDKAGLPAAAIHEPAAAPDGWHRTTALYFEDPSIGYEFGVPFAETRTPEGAVRLAERVAAEMKYTGENLLAYPGAWYQGLIGEEFGYNPRSHAPDFLSAFYSVFDREGLGFMPTLNVNNMPVPEDLVTRGSMSDGTLHPSPIAIHDTGRPNWGRWHDSPPNFNILHPDVQTYIRKVIRHLAEQGRDHPSFQGVCLHLTRHCLLWCGDDVSGYNDYAVEAFAKDCGIDVPMDKTDPMRGAAYAKWIRANCHGQWIQWRCDQVTAFYAEIGKMLRDIRPDLKLWANCFVPADIHHPDFGKPGFFERACRESGLDSVALAKAVPNLVIGQSLVPADYRKLKPQDYPNPWARSVEGGLDRNADYFTMLQGAASPWVHQHDRYWESAIGGGSKGTLTCDWMTECGWRVTTINPVGRHALRHFATPLRFHDLLGLSKGGFLIGTYGMEDVLVPFYQAFRALPAKVMADVAPKAGTPESAVRVRQCDFDGKSYFYVVNTDEKPVDVEVAFPDATTDLVTDKPVTTGRMRLDAYEMRSYSAPKGVLEWSLK